MNRTGPSKRQILPSASGGPGGGGAAGMVPGVKAGNLLFFSAIRGAGADRQWSDDTKMQARNALDTLKRLMEAAGGTLDNVARVTVFFEDLKYRAAFNEVWLEYFPQEPPARIALEVANASTGPDRQAHFVLDVIAVAP